MSKQEYVLTENDLIVSKTDLKGVITFVNNDLIRITGFTRSELIGAPHSIFRHSDMPKLAFEDMWRTIEKGLTWSGLVKNKAKDGSFYWVRASIAPIYENGQITGYMSVRRRPNFENVKIIEKIYADINAGRFNGELYHGNVLKKGIFHSTVRAFRNLTIRNRLIGLGLLSSASLLAVATVGYTSLNTLNEHTQLSAAQIQSHATEKLEALKHYQPSPQNDNLPDKELGKLVENLQTEIQTYVAETKQSSSEQFLKSQSELYEMVAVILSAFAVLFSVALAGIIRPLKRVTATLLEISNGNYLTRIDIDSLGEVNVMLEAMRSMSIRLGFDIAEDKKNLTEALRLKISLDNVSTGVMIANREREIVYVNKSVVQLLRNAQTDIRKDLPDFDVDNLIGTNIDTFHKMPAHQRSILENLTETQVAEAIVGGRHMVVKASPIINPLGQRLGAVAEWQDRTSEVLLEREISTIVHDAAHGYFSKRIMLDDDREFFKTLTSNLNTLLEVSDRIFGDLKRVLYAVSHCDLRETITANYEGEFNNLKNDTNRAVEQLKDIINQIKSVNHVVEQSIVSIKSGNEDLSERTESQVANLENAAAAIHELTFSVHQNDHDAKLATEAVNNVFTAVDAGVKVIKEVVSTMNDIHESSLRVVDIIAVIDSIAFQTNILALNASVEAARAGSQGRGFAVVAVEVQNLAKRVASAAGEVRALLTESEEKVENGSKLVMDAGQTMEGISKAINKVTFMMNRVAATCSEQSDCIHQIESVVMETEKMTEQNATLVTDATSASAALESQIRSLSDTIGYFSIR